MGTIYKTKNNKILLTALGGSVATACCCKTCQWYWNCTYDCTSGTWGAVTPVDPPSPEKK